MTLRLIHNNMLTFTWNISAGQEQANPPIHILNNLLQEMGGGARIERNANGCCLVIELENTKIIKNRHRIDAAEDLTLAQVSHARFMNVSMKEIAKTMGISVRTLYRRWNAATQAHVNPDTPYSQWP